MKPVAKLDFFVLMDEGGKSLAWDVTIPDAYALQHFNHCRSCSRSCSGSEVSKHANLTSTHIFVPFVKLKVWVTVCSGHWVDPGNRQTHISRYRWSTWNQSPLSMSPSPSSRQMQSLLRHNNNNSNNKQCLHSCTAFHNLDTNHMNGLYTYWLSTHGIYNNNEFWLFFNWLIFLCLWWLRLSPWKSLNGETFGNSRSGILHTERPPWSQTDNVTVLWAQHNFSTTSRNNSIRIFNKKNCAKCALKCTLKQETWPQIKLLLCLS